MWRRLDRDDPRRPAQQVARALTLGATALFWCVATAWRPWRLFARGGFSTDFYDEQARAFLRGRLHVDPAVAGHEGFLIGDQTYLYFGPALAVARMPAVLLGRALDGRLVLASMLVAFVVLGTWAYRLLGTAGRLAGARPAGPWRTAAFVGAVVGSPALFLAGWISVYHETEVWAGALAVVAATCMLEVLGAGERSGAWLVGAAAATVATVLTRASVGIGVALALVVVAVVRWRREPREGAWLAGAAAVGVGVHVVLNAAKFGSLLGLPADRQVLTLQDPERAAWFAGNDGSFFSLRFLPTTLLQYLRPDTIRFERLVPGIRFGPLAPDVGPYPVENTTPAASLTATAPLLVVLAVVGIVWLLRRRRWAPSLVVAGLVVGAVPSFAIGFIANRYLVDVLPALVVPGAIGAQVLARPVTRPRVMRVAVVLTVVWGLWANASLATWTLGLKSPGFTEVRYRVDAALFPPPRPGLVDLDHAAPVPRDGVVAIDGECAGVYVAEQGHWVALERSPERRAVGTVRDGVTSTDPLVATERWSLTFAAVGPAGAVGLLVDGRPVAELDVGRLRPGDEVEVVADPVTRELWVRAPERLVLFDPAVPARDDAMVVLGLEEHAPHPTRLCQLLSERR